MKWRPFARGPSPKVLCQRPFVEGPSYYLITVLHFDNSSKFWKYKYFYMGARVHFSILFWLMPDNFIQQRERLLIIFKLLQKDAFDHMMCCVQHAISCVNLYAIFKEYNALLFHWKVRSMLVNVLNSTYYTTNSVV